MYVERDCSEDLRNLLISYTLLKPIYEALLQLLPVILTSLYGQYQVLRGIAKAATTVVGDVRPAVRVPLPPYPRPGPLCLVCPSSLGCLRRRQVTHAGMPVESGVRSVFVASFSTRTAASPKDRVYGLQCAPSSSRSGAFGGA